MHSMFKELEAILKWNLSFTLWWFLKIFDYALFSFETIEDTENVPGQIRFSDGQYLNCAEEKY